MVLHVSHIPAYWIEAEPIGPAFTRCIDGGEVLAPRLWHPLRPPLLHQPASVPELAEELEESLNQAFIQHREALDDEFTYFQIAKLLELFQHAAEQGEAVVSFLDKPADHERACKVEIPDLRVSQ